MKHNQNTVQGGHMRKIKKAVATLALAATLAVTGGTVAQIATAENSKAEAYTYTQGPVKWQTDRYWNGTRYMCGVWAYIDYNWWEEVFQGKRDGWTRLYYAYC
ncbi:membrane protein [Arthrobacter phage EastWest]|uniref:Membrane protein n=1 Tax=Arthrobacter phage EastWest TaxID=2894292 RepID=A0AAE8YK58_9CAUD|nr:membrane protein [Arthrobacter phage EastWest]